MYNSVYDIYNFINIHYTSSHITHPEQVVCVGDGLWLNWTLWWPGNGDAQRARLQCIGMKWNEPVLNERFLVRPNFSPFIRWAFLDEESLQKLLFLSNETTKWFMMVYEWFMIVAKGRVLRHEHAKLDENPGRLSYISPEDMEDRRPASASLPVATLPLSSSWRLPTSRDFFASTSITIPSNIISIEKA